MLLSTLRLLVKAKSLFFVWIAGGNDKETDCECNG